VVFSGTENAYSEVNFTNLENSTDASVSDILQFLNTLQVRQLNFQDLKPTWESKLSGEHVPYRSPKDVMFPMNAIEELPFTMSPILL
jgi:hypothetical protein